MRRDNSLPKDFFYKELNYWKSLKVVLINEEAQGSTLGDIRSRFSDTVIQRQAKDRFESLISIVRLLKDEHRQRILRQLNDELGVELKEIPTFEDLESIKSTKLRKGAAAPLLADWVIGAAIIVVIIVIVIIAEANDNDGAGEDDTIIITAETGALASVVADGVYLDCEEISKLTYSAWVTYLNILLTKRTLMEESARANNELVMALVCANCSNLSAYTAAFNYDHSEILPGDPTWIGAFLYAAKLEECSIPY